MTSFLFFYIQETPRTKLWHMRLGIGRVLPKNDFVLFLRVGIRISSG